MSMSRLRSAVARVLQPVAAHADRRAAIIVSLAGLLALAACATPEMRVREGLIDAGLPAPLAACMAGRMVDRLSLAQLRRLQSLSKLRGSDVHSLPADQLLHKIRALEDPEILAVTGKAAFACAIAG
jgi:hypothetical protein